ncbi:MAG: pyruvate:ferredoxin (flavodoxin) oxidoreductase [Polyangiales bacterium]
MAHITVDGNEAAASVAYRASEVVAIYPISPASPMGEHCDEWAGEARTNLWGEVPRVVEMQSEAGAAGALHGALQAGALATSFTASQGLLLMIPDLYKIAGELTPFVLHVAARTVATHALSIFCDHSDVMACRGVGAAMLCAASVQEAQDLAAVAHAATLRARVPFVHFFDGFRTSHELARIASLSDDDLRALMDPAMIHAHRARALSPDHPVIRGTAQNPDTFFQAREAANPFYDHCADAVRDVMRALEARTGRAYAPFSYAGHPAAERVVVLMGSATETAAETVTHLAARGARVGAVKVTLCRPFDVAAFVATLPRTVRRIAVLDRTKEPGAPGEPLYLDVRAALDRVSDDDESPFAARPKVIGVRYGLASKDVTPGMIQAALDELGRDRPRHDRTLGIVDDVTRRSLPWDRALRVEPDDVHGAVVVGLGSDGSVGACKSVLKILGDEAGAFVQGHFVYDSRKAGAVTVSHLRAAPHPLRAPYLVTRARYLACHQPQLLDRIELRELCDDGATLVVNAPWAPHEAWARLPVDLRRAVLARRLRVQIIDAARVADACGLGHHLGTVMEALLLRALSDLSPARMRETLTASITKRFARKGPAVVAKNLDAVAQAFDALADVPVPDALGPLDAPPPRVPANAPDFVRRVTAALLDGRGESLPVSAFPVDGTWPVGTSRYDKRSLATALPVWDEARCIQCNKCALVCPHAAVRTLTFEPAHLDGAPAGVVTVPWKGDDRGDRYLVQVAPDDCTGCGLCVEACPAHDRADPTRRALMMHDAQGRKEIERPRWDWASTLPAHPRPRVHLDVKNSQLLEPYFQFSTACAGCGETPYLKLMTQLFGDRMLVANATGCSSIFGANLPTTPWTAGADGRGPAWANSLFEDNAEFGLGMRLALDARHALATRLLGQLRGALDPTLVDATLAAHGRDDASIAAQRARVSALRASLAAVDHPDARRLDDVLDDLVPRSVWIVGGDGWAYDIGYGGLDHVLASGADVNVLVLDTEVYSNTGGQQSKATPLGAAARFASHGRALGKKDLGLQAMTYGHVYVASVALGAKDAQTVKAFVEAERWRGPSLIIARAHCVAHGFELVHGLDEQRDAVAAGVWPLYRFDPAKIAQGEPPLHLDAPAPTQDLEAFMMREGRFSVIAREDPARHEALLARARVEVARRRVLYEQLAAMRYPVTEG